MLYAWLILGQYTDYGLFLPVENGSKSGIWLDFSQSLDFYLSGGAGESVPILKSGVTKAIVFQAL